MLETLKLSLTDWEKAKVALQYNLTKKGHTKSHNPTFFIRFMNLGTQRLCLHRGKS